MATQTRASLLVFRLACEAARQAGLLFGIQTPELQAKAAALGLDADAFGEAIDLLAEQGYIQAGQPLMSDPLPPYFNITTSGFERYLQTMLPDYPRTVATIKRFLIQQVQAGQQVNTAAVTRNFGVERLVVNHLLGQLSAAGTIKAITLNGGDQHVWDISSGLRQQYGTTHDTATR